MLRVAAAPSDGTRFAAALSMESPCSFFPSPVPRRRRFVALATATGLTFVVGPSSAQRPRFAGTVEVQAGLEGGGEGDASGVRRSRTTLRFGLEGWVDEQPHHRWSAALLAELEPKTGVGLELRYTRVFWDDFAAFAGATGILAPDQLIGVTAGVGWRPLFTEDLGITVGPAVTTYFIGNDLPDGLVLWQTNLQVGARVVF